MFDVTIECLCSLQYVDSLTLDRKFRASHEVRTTTVCDCTIIKKWMVVHEHSYDHIVTPTAPPFAVGVIIYPYESYG